MRRAVTNIAALGVAVFAFTMLVAGGGSQAASPSQIDPCITPSPTVEVTTTVVVTTTDPQQPTPTPTPDITPTPTPTPLPPGPARVVHAAPSGVDPCATPDLGSGGGTIPATGNDTSSLTSVGIVALVLGVALLGVALFRRAKPTTTG
ncbi:MAG: LPXTG cell wall anchor domain-containing protein [Actinomycetota bacterium]|nr:LPXTG cell wall anchor domain-containing protein [Actinomycetota bacterium]